MAWKFSEGKMGYPHDYGLCVNIESWIRDHPEDLPESVGAEITAVYTSRVLTELFAASIPGCDPAFPFTPEDFDGFSFYSGEVSDGSIRDNELRQRWVDEVLRM